MVWASAEVSPLERATAFVRQHPDPARYVTERPCADADAEPRLRIQGLGRVARIAGDETSIRSKAGREQDESGAIPQPASHGQWVGSNVDESAH